MLAEALASQRRVGRAGQLRAVLADHTRLIGVVKVGPSRAGADGAGGETVKINLVGRVRGGWGVNECVTTLRACLGCYGGTPRRADSGENLIDQSCSGSGRGILPRSRWTQIGQGRRVAGVISCGIRDLCGVKRAQ